jgi:hypothetical protein
MPHQPRTHHHKGTVCRVTPASTDRGPFDGACAAYEAQCSIPPTSLPEQEAESLPTSSLDTIHDLPSSGTHTPAAYCENDSLDCPSLKGMCGTWTFQQWMESMRFALDSLVKTSAQPEAGKESLASEADSIGKLCEQLTLFDLPGCSLKTAHSSGPEADTSSSVTLWREDIPGATESCPRLMSALRTGVTAGGALQGVPTPTVCGNYNRKGASQTSGDGLATFAAKWPTPRARDCQPEGLAGGMRRMEKKSTNSRPLREQIGASDGGPLNPAWVEWLMGWPIGHTASSASETVKSRSALRRRGASLEVRS